MGVHIIRYIFFVYRHIKYYVLSVISYKDSNVVTRHVYCTIGAVVSL